jgi:hypothetical protein
MRTGTDGTIDCKERCVLFPLFNMGSVCGSCTPVAPTTPATPTATAPIGADAPSISAPNAAPPTPAAGPIAAPTPGTGTFDITIDLVGSTSLLSSSDKLVITNTKKRWETIISADIQDVASSTLRNKPQFSGCKYPTIIDDLYICLQVGKDDGVGGTLGFASPTYQRLEDGSSKGLTIAGFINLDVDDVKNLIDNGTFDDVFLHEVGHILGIGTYFVAQGIAGTAQQRCPYRGVKATAEYKKISKCDVLPMENDGREGDGTYCAHWDEQCLKNELMTGFISFNGPNPLSRVTIGSLEDLGYPVDYSTADSYTASSLGSGCSCRRRQLEHGEGTLLRSSSMKTDEPRHRRHLQQLSEETRQYAIEQGLKFFQQNPTPPKSVFGSLFNTTTEEMNGVRYVGDQSVSVLVQDGPNGDIYGVHVDNPNYVPQ